MDIDDAADIVLGRKICEARKKICNLLDKERSTLLINSTQ